MRAIIHSAFGAPREVLAIGDVARPTPGPAEVLVRVRASGVAKGIWLITQGLPYIARPAYGLRAPKQPVAGLAFAGTVDAVGEDVDAFAVGDDVFGYHAGSMAEFVAAPPDALARKPDRVSFEEAAAAPVSGLAALQAVRDSGKVEEGHRVLVIGASGGVGSFAVQIAKAYGAEVTGVASTRNLALVRSLGADYVVDYTREDPLAGARRYDVVIDIAGNRRVSRLRRVLVPGGTLVMVGGTGGRWTMGFGRTVRGMLLSPFVPERIVGLISEPNPRDLRALAVLMETGKLAPAVERTVPFTAAAEAVEEAGSGHASGTIVVRVRG